MQRQGPPVATGIGDRGGIIGDRADLFDCGKEIFGYLYRSERAASNDDTAIRWRQFDR